MYLRNITALFQKQIKDIIKNPPLLVLYIVYPIVAAVMTSTINEQKDLGTFFVSTFATMHSIFTPIVVTTNIVAEEKEKNTLRALILSNVSLKVYLISIGGFVLLTDMITGCSFLFISPMSLTKSILFMSALIIGAIISIILGMIFGLLSKNASSANGFAAPSGMVFSFLPMLAYFNPSIEKFAKFTFGQQINYLLSGNGFSLFRISVILANLLILIILSSLLYKKSIIEN